MSSPSGSTTVVAKENPRFNAEDFQAINQYADYASSLPTVLPAVEIFVGYKSAHVAGLEPAELRSLFEQVHDNAGEWNAAKDRIGDDAASLVSISSSVVSSGEALIQSIRAMPFYTRITATVGGDALNLPPLQVPDEPLSATDAQKKTRLVGQLEALKNVNRQQIDGTDVSMQLLAGFRHGVEILEPLVAAKRQAVKNSNLEKIGKETTVEPMIAALQQEYDRAVQAGGPGAAIAEARKNDLRAAIDTLKGQMEVFRDRQRVTYTMGRLFAHFTELKMIMVDAEMAVGHLWVAWKEAAAALENSSVGFGNIDSTRKLVTFLAEFQTIIANWKLVQERATELNHLL